MNRKNTLAGFLISLLILSFTLFWFYQPQTNVVYRLPMQLEEKTFFPSFMVSLDGLTFDAKFDLGAKYTQIKSDALQSKYFERLGKFVKIRGLYSEEIYEVCKLDTLRIGDLLFHQIDFLDSKNRQSFISFKTEDGETTQENGSIPDIILGNSIFLEKVILLDYTEEICWVCDKAEDLFEHHILDETFHQGPLGYTNQHFFIEVVHDNLPKRFLIDTGSTSNFIAGVENRDNPVQMIDSNCRTVVFNGEKLDIGYTSVINRSFQGFDGVLGAAFLSMHLVALDPKNGTIWIKPLEE